MLNQIKIVDLFAGPGGLGEGFASVGPDNKPKFKIVVSVEKEAAAHKTLTLRAFTREFENRVLPLEYYQYVRGEITKKELIEKYKPTIMLIFPSHFESYPGLQYLDLSCVNWVLTGGSTIPIHFVRRLIKNEGVKNVAVIYGLTECLPPVIHKVVNIENLSEYNESEMGYIIDESGEYTVDDEDILTIKGSSHLCQTINDKPVDLFVTQDVVSADGNTFYFEKRNSDLIRIDDSLINPQQLVPYSLNGYCCIFSTSQTHVVVVLHHKDFKVPQLIQKLDDNGITHDKLVTPIELNVLGKPNINKLKGIYDKGN